MTADVEPAALPPAAPAEAIDTPVPNGHAIGMEVDHPQETQPFRPRMRFNAAVKEAKPSPSDVIVLALGSHSMRFGFAVDSTPHRVLSTVAFPRAPKPGRAVSAPIRVPPPSCLDESEMKAAQADFEAAVHEIAEELELGERRPGGGRPIPWVKEVETVRSRGVNHETGVGDVVDSPENVLVGRDADLLLLDKERAQHYDVVSPIWDGKLLFGCGATNSMIRSSLDALIRHVVQVLSADRASKLVKDNAEGERKGGEGSPSAATATKSLGMQLFKREKLAKVHVALVIPEASDRRDVAEFVQAIFRSEELQAAAVFVHQSAVSCALGAGIATCTVVDIGYSGTTIACVEDGIICGESRVHLAFGARHILNTFDMLLCRDSSFQQVMSGTEFAAQSGSGNGTNEFNSVTMADDRNTLVTRVAEQTCGFNVDENDTLSVVLVKVPSGRSFRVKTGVGVRALPCYGVLRPRLFKAAMNASGKSVDIPARKPYYRQSDDDNFLDDLKVDMRRSGMASAALPTGIFANEPGQPAAAVIDPSTASIVDAIIWSVTRAVSMKNQNNQPTSPDQFRRFLNAIVLAGGGASIDGIALALEARIVQGLQASGVNVTEVVIIDGGKGKGDEELLAAAAVLKDSGADDGLVDDTDTASLPWKGGAVMVEADAVTEYWVYRDDWEARHVRALCERVPFFW